MDAQTTLPWGEQSHRQRDQLIAGLALPKSITVSSRTVSAATCRAVLHRLDFYAQGGEWSYPSMPTLAEDLSRNEKTVRRALQALERLGLVDREVRKAAGVGIVLAHYRINWRRVAEFVAQPHPELLTTERTPGPSEGTQCPHAANRSERTPGPTERTPGPSERTPGPPTCNGMYVTKTPSPSTPARAADGVGVLKICWGREITPAELLRPAELLDELCEVTDAAGVTNGSEADQLALLALLAYCLRQKRVASRFGLFTAILEGRVRDRINPDAKWRSRPTDKDFDQAGRWFAQARADPLERPAPQPETEQQTNRERNAAADRREHQLRQLHRWSRHYQSTATCPPTAAPTPATRSALN